MVDPNPKDRRIPGDVPRQLPAPPAHFTGRADEVARLTRAFSGELAGTVMISAIGGAGGIGKTWLALHWAHRHADRFPDGQLHVDLRGFSPDSRPMPISTALSGFLSGLGVPSDAMPAEDHAKAALFRTLVADRRMLVVLDNAASIEQVTPLLPGSPTCAVLITSRRRFARLVNDYGARHLALDVLSRQDARDLLARRIGRERMNREPRAADELIAACGRYPLALSVVAGRAAAQPRLSLSSLVTALRKAGLDGLADGDVETNVSLVLSWSCRALMRRQAALFALLGVAPGPDIGVPAAASLAGMSVERTRADLRALEQVSLLVTYADERYRMHDLVRTFATALAERETEAVDRARASERVIEFYAHTAHAAHRLLEPHEIFLALRPPLPGCLPLEFGSQSDALAWLTAEHACLMAAQATACQERPSWAGWQLAWGITVYHHLRGLLAEDLCLWRAAHAAARTSREPAVGALVHRHLADAWLRLGNENAAAKHLDPAMDLACRSGDLDSQARNLRLVSIVHERQGHLQVALDRALDALDIFRSTENVVWEADTHNTVGWCYALLRRFHEARRHCLTACPVLLRHHPPGAADVLDTLGLIAHGLGRETEALGYFRHSLALYRDLGDAYHLPDTLERTGHVFAALGRADDARQVWLEAMRFYEAQQRVVDVRRVHRKIDTPRTLLAAHPWPQRRR